MIRVGVALALAPALAWAAPVEVGTVRWQRDLDAAIAESARDGKPVFAFFQEVPGCSGCQTFGSRVMSHPPIVEAVEHEFVPVLIYNNRDGADAEILKRYGEPAWNYQVVRFLDGRGEDLIPRKDRVWSRVALALRMMRALEAAGRPVPRYLEAVAYEDDERSLETVVFAQACFWAGEAALGRVPGVITTEAGWLEGREVTRVRYHPDLISLDALVDRAVAAGVADEVHVSLDPSYRPAGEEDQKRQIRGTPFSRLALSPMQATKVNAYVAVDADEALSWLTPSQREELERSSAAP